MEWNDGGGGGGTLHTGNKMYIHIRESSRTSTVLAGVHSCQTVLQ